MRCPFCKKADSRVIDSRAADDGNTIRRRRECTGCGKRFTTYEVIEKIPLMVIKNDGRRQVFDRNKLLNGLIRSCDKRDIPTERIVALADDIEKELRNTMDREVTAQAIGEFVMEKLKGFDEVAYIRFASVYRKFADISNFRDELDGLIQAKKGKVDRRK
jgi:transcriptional repressor NrdR